MPAVLPPDALWLANQIASLKADVAALKAQQTQFVTDPRGICWVIVGNLTYDQAGNPTGIGTSTTPQWGIASHMTGSWVRVA